MFAWAEIYAIVQQFYAHRPCDTPKCDMNTLASALMKTEQNWKVGLAHHKMGNSQVLFMICGSSQVSLPVMLYPFSLIIQQYSQGAEPEHQCVGSDVQCYDSFSNPPVQLRSRSTSFPCFSKVSPTNDILPEKWLIVCQKCKLLTYRLFWDDPLLKDCHLDPFGWPLQLPLWTDLSKYRPR